MYFKYRFYLKEKVSSDKTNKPLYEMLLILKTRKAPKVKKHWFYEVLV